MEDKFVENRASKLWKYRGTEGHCDGKEETVVTEEEQENRITILEALEVDGP